MPDNNVWLVQLGAERAALTQLLATMDASPGRAVQGAVVNAAAKAKSQAKTSAGEQPSARSLSAASRSPSKPSPGKPVSHTPSSMQTKNCAAASSTSATKPGRHPSSEPKDPIPTC
jgi:hypothetical protein